MKKSELKILIQALRRYSQKDRGFLPFTISYNMLEIILPFLSIILTSILLDGFTSGEPMEKMIRTAVFGSVIIFLLTQLCQYLQRKRSEHALRTWDLKDVWITEKNLTMDYELLEDSDAQFLIRKQRDYENLNGNMYNRLFGYVEQLTRSITTLILSLILAVPLFLSSGIFGVLLPAVMLTLVFLIQNKEGERKNKRLKQFDDECLQQDRVTTYYLYDLLEKYESGKDIRIFHQQTLIEKELDQSMKRRDHLLQQHFRIFFRYAGITESVSSLNGCLLYLFAGFIAVSGGITVGNAVKYINGITRFIESATQLTIQITGIRELLLHFEDFEAFMNLDKRRAQGTIPVEKRQDNKFSLEFRNVSFRYPNMEEYALKNLNLKLEIGDRTAIVGRNGSGKSTFIKLLCRLYDPTEGEILLNGIDIRKYDEQEYLKILAVVFQDYHIFNLKMGENIAASPEVDEARAIEAMQKAGLERLLAKLPDGINTYVGKTFSPTGFETSGGENQKLAIARAVYHRAPFVIMDEPTAALDPVAEYEVYAGFDRLVGSRTAFYISHRLASCRFCNEILVFDNGHIVQKGSHETLIAEKGLYSELWNAQAQYYK